MVKIRISCTVDGQSFFWPTVARQPMFRPCLYRKAFPFRVRDISIVVTGVDL
jgi:hypothetical protein